MNANMQREQATRTTDADEIMTTRRGTDGREQMTILVRVSDGLGNQLFQYAAGRYYAEKHGARLVVAIRNHDAESYGYPRPFSLSHFAIEAPYRKLTIKDRIASRVVTSSADFAAALRLKLPVAVVIEEQRQQFRFQSDLPIKGKPAAVYLTGYWQVHQMAQNVAPKLRSEFSFRATPTGKNKAMLRSIKAAPNAVSVHIRRGDYLLEPGGSVALHMHYYTEAMRRMKQRFPEATFFVFSDDIDFARANLPEDSSAIFVDHNDSLTAHEDIRLMSACRHHIIANSTFSWWGAWLNPDPDKVVFAPRKWIKASWATYDDLFPPNWELLG